MPAHIFNVDETGVTLDHNPPQFFCHVNKKPQCVTAGKSPEQTNG